MPHPENQPSTSNAAAGGEFASLQDNAQVRTENIPVNPQEEVQTSLLRSIERLREQERELLARTSLLDSYLRNSANSALPSLTPRTSRSNAQQGPSFPQPTATLYSDPLQTPTTPHDNPERISQHKYIRVSLIYLFNFASF